MLDLDHFKEYNDIGAHPGGDEALQGVAQGIGSVVRQGTEIVARFGGEEFAVILAETDAEGATIVAERVGGAVASCVCFRRHLTVSLGVAAVAGDGCDAKMLLR